MELMEKVKYKKTEVGLIPSDWEVKKLGDVAIVATGTTPPTSDLKNYGDEFYFVSPADLGKGKYILETGKKLSKQGFNISRKYPKNSVLFTCIGSTIGKSGIAPIELTSNQQINAIFPNDSFSSDFIFYNLNFVSSKIRASASEQAVPMINKTEFEKTLIPIPQKSEQTAIATALSDTDALISSLEKLIAKKRNIKQGAMQKLLTPQKDWIVKKLGELGKCIRGVSYNGERDLHPHDTNITVRLLRSNNVQDASVELSNLQFVDSTRVNPVQYLQNNDIVICMANGSKQLVGKSAIFKVTDNLKYTFGAFMGCFRINSNESKSAFIFYNFQSYQYRSFIDVLLSGSSINNLKPSDIESIDIPYPSPEEQNYIATILSDMDAEIITLETKLDKYKMLKQGMMQNLLTGKIRLI